MSRNFRPLAHALIRRIALLAVGCALLFSAVQGIWLYRSVQQQLLGNIQYLASSNIPLLSVSLWDIEPEAVRRQLSVIVARPGVAFARINVVTGQMFEAGDSSTLYNNRVTRFVIPMPNGSSKPLGELLIVQREAYIYQQVASSLIGMLLGYLLLTVLICGLVAYVLRRDLERPMREIAAFAGRLTPQSLTDPLRLQRGRREVHDEIDLVAGGFVTLQNALTEHIDSLDQQVEERTQQLETALGEIRALLTHDALTGCYNRAFLAERLPQEMTRAQRSGQPLALVFCDIDHFKQINDEYGHLVGDEVLTAAASRLLSQLRSDIDWVVRFGGEEFVIVLPDTGHDAAQQVAERLRDAIATSLRLQDGRRLQITASLGVALWQAGEGMEPWLKRADALLYQAKMRGRNQVAA
ncbi:diguanylate cyclase [Vogesella sp. LIG4]|uniref:GGDEF domain-containing protein n=1 Tax=Vogesella sp. LIG4 TaxID=1192162 RepID=UPI00081F9D28|nr:sensor domain-containing diguanylate cyclase [Vogesella sp. LIG4]SCK22506.1 diguanylate cyclase (GGDEF) domain-containing protein [Vogesella sp. LIG4]